MGQVISNSGEQMLGAPAPFFKFVMGSVWARRRGQPGISDFVTGNPQEPPLPEYHEALRRWSVPQRPDWYAYKMSEPEACAAVAASLQSRQGAAFDPEGVFLTNGAIAGLVVALRTVVDPGDEVIFFSPPWFGYEPMILDRGATPIRVKLAPPIFDLDLEALRAAVSPRTRVVIVNSPNNPTGRVYPADVLRELAAILEEASERNARPIYLVSDEAYSRVVFDGMPYPSPTTYYARSMLVYTYNKTLLTPGQRLGYIALRSDMPDRNLLSPAILLGQIATGWAFPNALMQHALGDLEHLSIDIGHLRTKRDRVVEGLRRAGYHVASPEGTFYILLPAPGGDDMAFTDTLAEQDVFVLPGSTMELPGYVRISLTASDAMIDRALPIFESAADRAPA